jgi:hypothetical protein
MMFLEKSIQKLLDDYTRLIKIADDKKRVIQTKSL